MSFDYLTADWTFLGNNKDEISACVSIIGAGALIIAIRTWRAGRAVRDFNAVVTTHKEVRERMDALRLVARVEVRVPADYQYAVLNYLNALDVAAFSLNRKHFNRAVARYEST